MAQRKLTEVAWDCARKRVPVQSHSAAEAGQTREPVRQRSGETVGRESEIGEVGKLSELQQLRDATELWSAKRIECAVCAAVVVPR